MNEKIADAGIVLSYSQGMKDKIDSDLRDASNQNKRKIVVLDDDPTGIQTVHDVSVYTDWSEDSLTRGFTEKRNLFFVLTNSRSFTADQTRRAHTEIAENLIKVSHKTGIDFVLISRGDSTLRGHYPLETEVLEKTIQKKSGVGIDGEILCPYFNEGGRYTLNDTHYVRYAENLIPCANTEFAEDKTFGYRSSNLREYIEEKTQGEFSAESVLSVSLYLLRTMDYDAICGMLMGLNGFNKIIVNATCDYDVKVFAVALLRAMAAGKRYMIRSAAALVKAVGNISDRPLLSHDELIEENNAGRGGIIVVGSHTDKTTKQLEELRKLNNINFIEMDSDLVLKPGRLNEECKRIVKEEDTLIRAGRTVCVSTKRKELTLKDDTPEQALIRSVEISEAIQNCVGKLSSVPSFVVAKGGITSSDVGTKALGVKKAEVMGQIMPGVPVWKTDKESRFPRIPYIIFPGNVGTDSTLREAVEKLI
ncbi:MAG: hydroxyacid dehydrogenase [Clostridiales bacterium]|nr:hydroxyacid dehydrogenase [Clostridiales bacterium]